MRAVKNLHFRSHDVSALRTYLLRSLRSSSDQNVLVISHARTKRGARAFGSLAPRLGIFYQRQTRMQFHKTVQERTENMLVWSLRWFFPSLVTSCLLKLLWTASCSSMLQSLVYLHFGRVSESVIPENDGVEKLQLLLLSLLQQFDYVQTRSQILLLINKF